MKLWLALLFFVSLSCSASASEPPLPLWYGQFKVDFNETNKYLFIEAKTTGTWYYDAVARAEVIDRASGQGDRYCGSIHPFTTTPCRHLVVEGKRYLVFPELKDCCLCCVAAQGCGILSPRWLDDAEYLGKTHLRGREVFKFNKKGLQANLYYSTADDDQLPVELDQVPNDYQSFDVPTFSQDPIDPQLLEIPQYCKSRCPLTSVCTFARDNHDSVASDDEAVEQSSSSHSIHKPT